MSTSLTHRISRGHYSVTQRSLLAIAVIAISFTAPVATTRRSPARAEAAALNATWQAPTMNTDGSPLTNLTAYRVYVATSSPACHAPSVVTVTSPVPTPAQGDAVAYRLSNLTAGTTYFVAVSAVDSLQLESGCIQASGTAHASFSLSPLQLDFGSTTVGTSVDRTFTVSNPGSTSVSVAVVASAPFALPDGGSYTIAPGGTQNVVVRFAPKSVATFTANIGFAADGDTLTGSVSGTATRQRGKKPRA